MKKILPILILLMAVFLSVGISAAEDGLSFQTAVTLTDYYDIPVSGTGSFDRYYKFTAPVTGTYRVQTVDTIAAEVYCGFYDSGYEEVIALDNPVGAFKIKTTLEEGKTYYIHTGTQSGASGSLSYSLRLYYETKVGDYKVYGYGASYELLEYTGSDTVVTLPETLGGLPVFLGGSVFSGNTAITAVTVPSSYTAIGVSCFDGCTNLSTVVLQEGLEVIGDSAFKDCSSLTSIILPETMTTVGYRAFYKCVSLTEMLLPDGIETIDSQAFRGCTALSWLVLPEKLQTIGTYAFADCTSLTMVLLPASVDEVGNNAFRNCTGLIDFTYTGMDAKFGSKCFDGCESLTIYGYAGSTIETYAADKGITFEEIVVIDPDPDAPPIDPDPLPEIEFGEAAAVETPFSVFEPAYTYLCAFHDGYATAVTGENGLSAVVDDSNMIHYTSAADGMGNYAEDIVAVYDAQNESITFTRLDGFAFTLEGYTWAGEFLGGKCAVFNTDGQYVLIDSCGNLLLDEPCDDLIYDETDTVLVCRDAEWVTVRIQQTASREEALTGFSYESSAVALASDFELLAPVLSVTGEHIICSDGTAYGILDTSNNPLTEFKYDTIYDAENGLFVAYYGDYVDLIETDGTVSAALEAYCVGGYSEGKLPCFDGESYTYIDKYGNTVLTVEAENVTFAEPFYDDFAVVYLQGRGYSYINTDGVLAADAVWDYAGRFANGYALVMETAVSEEEGSIRLWSIIDTSFDVVMTLDDDVYVDSADEHAADFSNGYIRTVSRDTGLVGFVRLDGLEVPDDDTFYTISGTVKNGASADDPVTLRVFDENGNAAGEKTITSDTYEISLLSGEYTLEISQEGRSTRRYAVTVSRSDIILSLNLYLTGDVNGDGLVNMADAASFAVNCDKNGAYPLYDDSYDFNSDGTIDRSDAVIFVWRLVGELS